MLRIFGNASLVFEEFDTILTQIEAVLNSRPISPLSSDPNDLSPLTPAHFLVGRSLTAPPEADFQEIHENRLSRYQRVQKLVQHFWHRWSQEYIGELQQRTKWASNTGPQLKIGTMVILREDNLPPRQWHLGRVVEVHPGTDNIVRVASVLTQRGITKRAVRKLCVLPVEI